MSSPISRLSSDQWMDIIQYLGTNDFKAMRLAGTKAMCLSEPKLTSHLQLRMDRIPFFCENNTQLSEEFERLWLADRHSLVINDANAKMSPSRVGYLVTNGFLDSITEITVHDCHRHRTIIEILSNLPNVKTLVLIDQGEEQEAIDELEAIISHAGNMRSLESLDVDFTTVVYGSRLSFLRNLQHLKHLRLVGFDLCEGVGYVGSLVSLQTLHLCHGNFYSSPNDDANEKDLMSLIGLTNIRHVHLEGFDCLTGVGLGPFGATGSIRHLALKHCQELSDECLTYAGRMTGLESLHFVMSSCECDDIDVFDEESLQHLNTLYSLKTLSLFYLLDDPAVLRVLPGLTSLETLNIAFEETLDNEEVENLCREVLQVFPSLRRLRIFSEDSMDCSFQYCGLDVDIATFNFGDLVHLD